MNKPLLKDSFGWGFILWLIGYLLGIVLFFVVPPALLGWVIMPIGTIITFLILTKKIKGPNFQYYIFVACAWTLIAVVLDYFLIVKTFKPADGYYKLDVYIYYLLTFIMPLAVGWWKKGKTS